MRNRLLSPRECRDMGLRYTPPIEPPRIKLPNGCGLLAVRRAWALARSGNVPSRILHIQCGRDAHAVLIFAHPDGSHFSFDAGGTLRLRGITKASRSLEVARVYARAMGRRLGPLRDVTEAHWLSGNVRS